MIIKTQALVLNTQPYSNTSQLVTWLTPDYGKVMSLTKGAMRPKSGFIGHCDLFYHCEVLFHTRSLGHLFLTRETAILEPFVSFRTDWRRSALASCVSHLADQSCPMQDAPEGLFDALLSVLHAADHGADAETLLYWYEMQLLNRLGVAPQLQHCIQCRKRYRSGIGAAGSLSVAKGGLICSRCREQRDKETVIPADVIAILRKWQETPSLKQALVMKCTPAQLEKCAWTLAAFLQYHLDISYESRRIALNLIRRKIPTAA